MGWGLLVQKAALTHSKAAGLIRQSLNMYTSLSYYIKPCCAVQAYCVVAHLTGRPLLRVRRACFRSVGTATTPLPFTGAGKVLVGPQRQVHC